MRPTHDIPSVLIVAVETYESKGVARRRHIRRYRRDDGAIDLENETSHDTNGAGPNTLEELRISCIDRDACINDCLRGSRDSHSRNDMRVRARRISEPGVFMIRCVGREVRRAQ